MWYVIICMYLLKVIPSFFLGFIYINYNISSIIYYNNTPILECISQTRPFTPAPPRLHHHHPPAYTTTTTRLHYQNHDNHHRHYNHPRLHYQNHDHHHLHFNQPPSTLPQPPLSSAQTTTIFTYRLDYHHCHHHHYHPPTSPPLSRPTPPPPLPLPTTSDNYCDYDI